MINLQDLSLQYSDEPDGIGSLLHKSFGDFSIWSFLQFLPLFSTTLEKSR